MRYNYHTHTVRCHHAQGLDRDYVEQAIQGGITTLGFSDHVPYPFVSDHVSGIRMSLAETSEYVESLCRLREEYKDQIDIRIGFEVEYDPRSFFRLQEFLDPFPYDYMIQGQHFLDMDQETVYCGVPTADEQIIAGYAERVIEGMQSGYFLYTAHPDLIYYTGDEKIYERYMRPVCQAAKRYRRPLEINLLGILEGRHYPSDRFFRIAGEEGCEAVIGYDAHKPEVLNDEALYQRGVRFAQQWGLQLTEQPL